MNKTIIIVIAVILIAVGGALALAKNSKGNDSSSTPATSSTTPSDSSTAPSPEPSAATSNSGQSDMATITYTDNGFSGGTLTVKSGSQITVKNNAKNSLQFNSDPHPAHTDDPELNIGIIRPGESKTITLTKTGSHGYHNHLNEDEKGTIIVQ